MNKIKMNKLIKIGIFLIIFSYINTAIINIRIDTILILIFLAMLVPLVVINMYSGTKKYYRYALHKYTDYILVDSNKYILLTNLNKINADSAKVSAMSLGANIMSADSVLSTILGLGFYGVGLNIDDNVINQSQYSYDEFLTKLKNNKIKNYVAKIYENVRYLKENKYTYYFKGDLIKKNGSVVRNKRFKIQKIYYNHESLKVIK